MKFTFYTDDVTKLSAGLLGLLVFEEQLGEGAIFKAVDGRLDGLVTRLVADEQFKGKKGQTLSLHTHGRVGPQRILLVGGGARKDLQPADLRGFAARVVKAGRRRAGDRGRGGAAVPRGWRQRRPRPSAPRSSSPRARRSAATSSTSTSRATRRSRSPSRK